MDVKMRILDFPKTEKEVITFFHEKGLLPKAKQCVNGHNMTLYSFDKNPRWSCASWAFQKLYGLCVNTSLPQGRMPFVTAIDFIYLWVYESSSMAVLCDTSAFWVACIL